LLQLVAAVALTKTAVTFNLTVAVQAVAALVQPQQHLEPQLVAWPIKATTAAMVRPGEIQPQTVVAAVAAPALLVLLAQDQSVALVAQVRLVQSQGRA
jgi:hypothetical protein